MSRVPRPPWPGVTRLHTLGVVALSVLLLAASVLVEPADRAPGSISPATGRSGPVVPVSGAGPACGSSPFAPNDLVVGPGSGPCIIEASGPGTTYTQAGNVTVLPGGVLIIRSITFSIQQFVSSTGTPMQRLSHIYAFRDEGSVQLWNATLTTSATGSTPYLKLDLNITGEMSVWNSSFEFPGWVNVYGPGASLTLNASTIEANPAATTTTYQSLGRTIVGDTSYAASLSTQAGARLVMLNSNYTDTYSDDTQSAANGMPGPLPLASTLAFQLSPGSGRNVTSFETPTGSASLLQDWLYPTGVLAGYVELSYTAATQVSTAVTVGYDGTLWPLNSISFGPGSPGSTAVIPLSSSLVGRVNHLGMLQYLNLTGAFPGTSPGISIDFAASAFGTANISAVSLILLPLLVYDLTSQGSNSSVTVIGTTLGINWNSVPSSPVSLSPPYPWDSNKLLLDNGAIAFLAGLTIPTPYPGASATSAILPDSSSNAYLFRWAAFPVTGRGGIPVPGARAVAYYATAGGSTNVTVNTLNELNRSNPVLWGYVQWWDAAHGIPSYGVTSATGPSPGVAFLLLASNNLTEAALPYGVFLGAYNAKIIPPILGVATASFSFSLTPYPSGLTNASPDVAPPTNFPEFAAGLSIRSLSFTVDGVPSTAAVHIGQSLGVTASVLNTGTAPVENLSATMSYEPPSGGATVVASVPLTNESVPANQTAVIELSWNLSESVIGEIGAISATLAIQIVWNGGPSIGDGGSIGTTTPVAILPSYVRITSLPTYPQLLQPDTTYSSGGTIAYNGSGTASLTLTATPLGGGAALVLANASSALGHFSLSFNSSALQSGVLYSLTLNASYNSAFAPSATLPGNYSLIAARTPQLAVTSVLVTADGVGPASSVRIGQVLGVSITLFNDGTGATTNLSGILIFLEAGSGPGTLVATLPLFNVSIAAGQSYRTNFTWTVSELVVGEVGSVSATFRATFAWNGGSVPFGGGVVSTSAPVSVQPSQVRIVTFQPYPSTLQVDSNYTSSGTVAFNGSGRAFIELIATPTAGPAFVLTETNATAGAFNLTLPSYRLVAGVEYNLSIEATYNTASAPVYRGAGSVALASGGPTTPSFGLWLALAIGAAAILAILLLILLLRRSRTSEARECGECGSLVAAGEQSCPRCGTWFETKSIPCPSCGAAVPADAGVCPECATAAPDRPTVVRASEEERQAYEEFVGHYRAAAAGELGEDYPESQFWAWWKQQPSYYSFRAWRKREERDSRPIDPPAEPEPSDEELF